MLWLAHGHARRGELNAANVLIDLVQVQAKAERDATDAPAEATAALHAALELRGSLHAMARP